jgi:hypothetical protein
MTYKLRVGDGTSKWTDFCTRENLHTEDAVEQFLAKYNGWDIQYSNYIEFDTEADALTFRLAFGV